MAGTAKFSVGQKVVYQIDGNTYTVAVVHSEQSPATYDISSATKHLTGVPEAALSAAPGSN